MTQPTAAWPRVLFALAVMAGLSSLGLWQLDRAEQKRALRARFERVIDAPPLDLALHGVEPLTDHPWRPVSGAGRYEPPSFLLDNRVRDGRVGYEVLSTFRLTDGARILVDRGWIAAPATRTDIPAIDLPPATIDGVRGRLAPSPSTGVIVGQAAEPEQIGPALHRLQHVDFATLSARFPPGYLPMLVYLDADEPGGYDRAWRLPAADDGKHTAYAVQWFAMAGAVAILLGIFLRRRYAGAPTTDTP